MLLSRMRRTFGKSLDKLISFSEAGGFTTYSMRQRFPCYNKAHTDPVVTDYFYARFVQDWCYDVPSYNYWFQMSIGFTLAILSCSRHLLFNPDVYVRRQEIKKPHSDRIRQHAYALPFFNHQLRNMSRKYSWMYIDNEYDLNDAAHPAGYRPARHQSHNRCFGVLSVPRYADQDPYHKTCSTKNMAKMYRDIGYSKL
eukprot:GEMP01050830.1.p1 GENE.GEMP01050830.1~~GEMP01050830.1.p1  ORF type:complete len:197 (+),score=22.52 GEMP01050830.1:82-672(+)